MADAGVKLSQLTRTVLKLITKENYFSALDYLQICEDVLEDLPTSDLTILVLNNTAMCYQKIGKLEDCFKYLEACTRHLKTLEESDQLVVKVKACRVGCKYAAQACAVLSQLNRHEEALAHAKELMESSRRLVCLLQGLCAELESTRRLSSSGKIWNTTDKGASSGRHFPKDETVERAGEVVKYLDDFISNRGSMQPPDMSYRSPLGIQKFNEWIFNYSIGTIMTVNAVTPLEAKTPASWDTQLNKDSLIHISSIIIIAYFCLATEMRFKYTSEGDVAKVKESEVWHRRSIELATSLLPLECPLLEHLKVSYSRNYSVILDEFVNSSRHKFKIPVIKNKPASRTTFASPVKGEKPKSRTITPVNSAERGIVKISRLVPGIRFVSSPYMRRVIGKKTALDSKRLIRNKFDSPCTPNEI